ncbi:hypothetical protein BSLG_000363 [Batrachochytrium salamandrivorans]|nr:hypothetical protein BASA62_001341 [Batrachochytrium salamandrivorans]KAH9271615.1 hypothetical protein BASA83_006225 [Batrachochytrium salamandrivorans]KAJ1344848.1 hypothetical protein BSLG_000363 [Batrachochytrium salamandrivorans]
MQHHRIPADRQHSSELSNSTISSSSPRATKADQLLLNFYSKTAQVIVQSRLAHILPGRHHSVNTFNAYSSNTHNDNGIASRDTTNGSASGQAATSTDPRNVPAAGNYSGPSSSGQSSPIPSKPRKSNKWFNIELDDVEPLREEMRFWKQQIIGTAQPLPLTLETYLDISDIPLACHLLLRNSTSRKTLRIGKELLTGLDSVGRPIRKTKIILESWQLSLSHAIPTQPPDLPVVYKKSIVFFRSLYSMLRLMPAYRLCRKLRTSKDLPFSLMYRVSTSRASYHDDVGLDQLHAGNDIRQGLSEHNFSSIESPLGIINLHVAYRVECDFSIGSPEYSLSERYVDIEEGFFSSSSSPMVKPEACMPVHALPTSSRKNPPERLTFDLLELASGRSLRRVSTSSQSLQDRSSAPNSSGVSLNSDTSSKLFHSRHRSVGSSNPNDYREACDDLPQSHSHRNFHSSNTISGATSSSGSPGYVAFTPPFDPSVLNNHGSSSIPFFPNEPPPFSTAHLSTDYTPTVSKLRSTTASPPFSMPRHQQSLTSSISLRNNSLNQHTQPTHTLHHVRQQRQSLLNEQLKGRTSLELARRSSFTLSTTSPIGYSHESVNSTSIGATPPPLLFTPSSPFTHPVLQSYKLSPPPLMLFNPAEMTTVHKIDDRFRKNETNVSTLRFGGMSRAFSESNAVVLSSNIQEALSAANIRMPTQGILQNTATDASASMRRIRSQNALTRFKKLKDLNTNFIDTVLPAAAGYGEPTSTFSEHGKADSFSRSKKSAQLNAAPASRTTSVQVADANAQRQRHFSSKEFSLCPTSISEISNEVVNTVSLDHHQAVPHSKVSDLEPPFSVSSEVISSSRKTKFRPSTALATNFAVDISTEGIEKPPYPANLSATMDQCLKDIMVSDFERRRSSGISSSMRASLLSVEPKDDVPQRVPLFMSDGATPSLASTTVDRMRELKSFSGRQHASQLTPFIQKFSLGIDQNESNGSPSQLGIHGSLNVSPPRDLSHEPLFRRDLTPGHPITNVASDGWTRNGLFNEKMCLGSESNSLDIKEIPIVSTLSGKDDYRTSSSLDLSNSAEPPFRLSLPSDVMYFRNPQPVNSHHPPAKSYDFEPLGSEGVHHISTNVVNTALSRDSVSNGADLPMRTQWPSLRTASARRKRDHHLDEEDDLVFNMSELDMGDDHLQ